MNQPTHEIDRLALISLIEKHKQSIRQTHTRRKIVIDEFWEETLQATMMDVNEIDTIGVASIQVATIQHPKFNVVKFLKEVVEDKNMLIF